MYNTSLFDALWRSPRPSTMATHEARSMADAQLITTGGTILVSNGPLYDMWLLTIMLRSLSPNRIEIVQSVEMHGRYSQESDGIAVLCGSNKC
jgi:hypothetical protein